MNDRIPGFCVEGRPICVESMRFQNYLGPFGRGVRVFIANNITALTDRRLLIINNEIGTWLINQALVVQKVDDAMHWMNPVIRQYLLNTWILQW